MTTEKANINAGSCGSLKFFFDEEQYSVEQFLSDYKDWFLVREHGVDNYLKIKAKKNISKEGKSSSKKLTTLEEIRAKRNLDKLNEENLQGYHNFQSLILISSGIFIGVWLQKYGRTKIDDHNKQFFGDLLMTSETHQITYIYEYEGEKGGTYKISADAVSLANLVADDLLKQKLNGNPRLEEKVKISESVKGFVKTILFNEIKDYFNKKATSKVGFNSQLIPRAKEITTKEYSKNSKISKYIEEKKYTFFEDGDGFSLERKDLLDQEYRLPEEEKKKHLATLKNFISKAPKMAKPSLENSSINPDDATTEEEKDKLVEKLIQIESMWRVFTSETLADILYNSAKKIKYVRYGFLDTAFKQVLSTHHYLPDDPSIESRVDEFGIEDSLIEDDWYGYLIESKEFDLSNLCESYLYGELENIKEIDYELYKIFVEYLKKWLKLIQSNLDNQNNDEDIKKELKKKMGTKKFEIASNLYDQLLSKVRGRQKELNGEKVEDIPFFASLIKYLSRGTT